MASLTQLVDEVLLLVEGYGAGHSTVGTTTGSTSSSTATIAVAGGVRFAPGLVEVGDELVFATGFDAEAGTLTGCVRGYRGTTAATHAAGTLVRSQPKFPRAQIKRAINDTVNSLFPRVAAVGTLTTTVSSGSVRYELPATAAQVLSVSVEAPGTSGQWVACTRWSFDGNAPETSGKAVQVGDGFVGANLRVQYSKPATELGDSDDFTATGLPVYCREVVVHGAAWRVMSFFESGKVTVTTAAQSALNGATAQPGQGTNLSKYFAGMFAQGLDAAEKRFRTEHPAVRHYQV